MLKRVELLNQEIILMQQEWLWLLWLIQLLKKKLLNNLRYYLQAKTSPIGEVFYLVYLKHGDFIAKLFWTISFKN